MVRWMRWQEWQVVWGRARCLSATETPHNTEYLRVSGEETFVALKPESQRGDWHYTRDLPDILAFNPCVPRIDKTQSKELSYDGI